MSVLHELDQNNCAVCSKPATWYDGECGEYFCSQDCSDGFHEGFEETVPEDDEENIEESDN